MVEPKAIPIRVQAALSPEDQSRADLYSLLARLFYAGPDDRLLEMIGAARTMIGADADATLADAWRAFVEVASRADPDAEVAAFDEVFVGTGKARITPYITYYLVEQGRERVLVQLRDDLAALGLGRKGGVLEPEDHFASLCEVMRHLASQGSDDEALRAQREFFDRYLRKGYEDWCEAIAAGPGVSPFYRAAGGLVRAFFEIEARGLDMIE